MVHQDIIEILAVWWTRNSHPAAFSLPAQGSIQRCRFAWIVFISKDDDVADA